MKSATNASPQHAEVYVISQTVSLVHSSNNVSENKPIMLPNQILKMLANL